MKFARYIGTGLLAIGIVALSLGFKIANYKLYFLITGGVAAAIGFYLVKILDKKEEETSFIKFDKWRKDLKVTGIEIKVSFDRCELKSNKYREEIEKDFSPASKYMALDELIGKDNTEYNNIEQSIVVFKTDFNGAKVTFYSPLISKEKTTLEFLLANKESTEIYVNRYNPNDYYFNLEFLWEENA